MEKVFATVFFLLVLTACDRPPNYNVYNPPLTAFTCEGKVVGGYYADPEAFCQLFHICVQIDESQVQDFRFLCPNDTLFDQENFVCADWRDVDCSLAERFYVKNLELFKTDEELDRSKRQLFEAPVMPNEEQPSTNFTCVSGGFFADVSTDCQLFHKCRSSGVGEWTDQLFRCLNGTVFDQSKLICRSKDKVDCSKVTEMYSSVSEPLMPVQIYDEDDGIWEDASNSTQLPE